MKTNKTLARLFALMLTVLLLAGAVTAMAASVYDDNGDGRVDVLDLISLLLKMENGEDGVTAQTLMNAIRCIINPDAPDPSKHYKILIIGNSYVYNGNAVILKSASIKDQASRENDMGYFYQLCRLNGYDVTVTNWTFGGHGLYDFCDKPCSRSSCSNAIHQNDLTDPAFDYVIISPGGGSTSAESFVEDFDYLMTFFRKANPDVKIVCLGNLGAHGYSSFGTKEPDIYTHYKNLESQGVIIADWGGLVNGILNGTYKVPNAEQSYLKKTFIIKDGYHPNPLAGYITSLMAYCAITGDSAVGQPYEFCIDKTVNANFDMTKYINNNYVNGDTNFLDVFRSKNDINGIQKLVDEYLKTKPYLTAAPQTVELTSLPSSEMISLLTEGGPFPNGQSFSGILGSKGAVASKEYSASKLTDAQKADIADIGYGISVIGIEKMNGQSNGYKTAVENLINGDWSANQTCNVTFDDSLYTVDGQAGGADAAYRALITLNFGSVHTFDAVGFFSGNLQGFPAAADVYVSDDGKNWTKVPTACWDALKDKALTGINKATLPKDLWNDYQAQAAALFDMGGISGQYIRLGIVTGRYDSSHMNNTINTRELVVYGNGAEA